MPEIIDPETLYVDDLLGIWSPVQWELTEEERIQAVEEQATAGLLWTVGVPEAVLRLFLAETGIERIFAPPRGYDEGQQGEWDDSLLTFAFKRKIRLESVTRSPDRLEVIYQFAELGYWRFEISAEKVILERI